MPHADELRILHWNIHSWRDEDGESNAEAVVGLIVEHTPHAVSLVEVDESWGMPSVLAEVAAKCGYSWVFGPSFEFGADATAGGTASTRPAPGPKIAPSERARTPRRGGRVRGVVDRVTFSVPSSRARPSRPGPPDPGGHTAPDADAADAAPTVLRL